MGGLFCAGGRRRTAVFPTKATTVLPARKTSQQKYLLRATGRSNSDDYRSSRIRRSCDGVPLRDEARREFLRN